MNPRVKILQSRIDAIGLKRATERIVQFAQGDTPSVVCLANVHMVVTATEHAELREVMEQAELVLPDGMPLVKEIRKKHPAQERVAGYDLIIETLKQCEISGIQVSFIGSTEQTQQRIAAELKKAFPRLKAPNFLAMPFFKIEETFGKEHEDLISRCGQGVVFVGLGCPKQEIWMHRMRPHSKACMLGVGAAFHLLAGEFTRAPDWVRENSLEWAYRLIQEPKKLARRYLVTNMKFIVKKRISRK